jgi:hypothetical protein
MLVPVEEKKSEAETPEVVPYYTGSAKELEDMHRDFRREIEEWGRELGAYGSKQ